MCARRLYAIYKNKIKNVSEVGFEPTPSFEDQNTQPTTAGKDILESGALDRSAILTRFKYVFYCKVLYTKIVFSSVDSVHQIA